MQYISTILWRPHSKMLNWEWMPLSSTNHASSCDTQMTSTHQGCSCHSHHGHDGWAESKSLFQTPLQQVQILELQEHIRREIKQSYSVTNLVIFYYTPTWNTQRNKQNLFVPVINLYFSNRYFSVKHALFNWCVMLDSCSRLMRCDWPGRTGAGVGPHHTRSSALGSSVPEAHGPGPGRSPARRWWWRTCAGQPGEAQSACRRSHRCSGGAHLWEGKPRLRWD